MKVECKQKGNGIQTKYRNKKFNLVYPNKIWQSYPKKIKEVLFDNLAHLLTINMPVVAEKNVLEYNTSMPLFYSFFRNMVLNNIPSLIEDYKPTTHQMLEHFLKIRYLFKDNEVKIPSYTTELKHRAVVPLSFGKDSLLSFALANELGLEPVGVYINDTISGIENRIKLRQLKKMSKEFKIIEIRNEIENLNDFEFWNKDETMVGYSHMMTGFCFISLPVLNYYKAKYIVLGNQQDMNFSFVNKDGFVTHPAVCQTREWMAKQNKMIKKMTANKAAVVSLIEPLTNISITKILFSRYPDIAKYQISCDSLLASNERRWCHECNKCARTFLFMKAFNFDARQVGFHKNLLQKQFKNHFTLFSGKHVDMYEKSKESKEQQLLAFYLAYKNKAKGSLMDLFKKRFLKEATQREDELRKKYFKIYPATTIPVKLKKKLMSIYREKLGSLI